jgi:hypothetical protein
MKDRMRACDASLADLKITENRVRQSADLSSRFKLMLPVQSRLKKYSLKATGKSALQLRPSRLREGRWPSSRTLGGMRWTRQRRKTSGAQADGEVVWS